MYIYMYVYLYIYIRYSLCMDIGNVAGVMRYFPAHSITFAFKDRYKMFFTGLYSKPDIYQVYLHVTYIFIFLSMHINTCICVYIYIYIYICTYIYVHIYSHLKIDIRYFSLSCIVNLTSTRYNDDDV
jgi:hypothetical protein